MKKIITFLIACMVILCLAACNDGSGSATQNGSAGENVGKIEDKAGKKDANAFIPDDSYVIYKQTSTKTGVVWIYEYNEKGHVTKIAHTYPDGRSSEDEIYDYTYNDDGSYSFHKTGWGSEYIHKYDAKGRLVEEIIDPNNRRVVTNTYTYVNDTTVDYVSRTNEGLTRQKDRNYYDGNGLLTKAEHFRSDGLLLAYTVYSYDENGNETTHTQYTPEGEINSNNAVYEWEQDYDEYGRLTRKAQRHTATGGFQHEEVYEYDDVARTYKVIITTGVTVYEYRPLSECIK